jgi:ABC-type multidrug transport system fused ATPase/permease subunit
VSIARSILKSAPILLCDEATSSLDGRTESEVMASLKQLAKTRTTVIVAHRLATVQDADQILVMDQGRVVESGRHAELLGTPGSLYARMWSHQDMHPPPPPAGFAGHVK